MLTFSTEEQLQEVEQRNPGEPEFQQAVKEVFHSIEKVLDSFPAFIHEKVLERIVEPERTIIFRVPWIDDDNNFHVNRGFRVEMNSALGPYKGGLRYHPSVNFSIMKFLAFEQIFKNSLTGLNLGGAKGGADFNPKGKSDLEVQRFSQSFMNELFRHIGEKTDVPAGDIGVGGREIGYLFGQYKKLKNQFTGSLTGKGTHWGGSFLRPEATGYGLVYFAARMLETRDETFEGKTCVVSGSGNVAQFTVEKLNELGAKVVAMSDSDGVIFDGDGIGREKLNFIKELKNLRRGRISEYKDEFSSAEYYVKSGDGGYHPEWSIKADCVFPCATQNEINKKEARNLIDNGVELVAEGANMPTTVDGVNLFIDKGILYGPAKAANAGGVAVSGLEMAQNSAGIPWTKERVDNELYGIMTKIHDTCLDYSEKYSDKGNYVDGANIAGFIKVAQAMVDQGFV
ncbi:MAG: NADP-specific glutamate dehydrogenase [Spirochaetia bacterium]